MNRSRILPIFPLLIARAALAQQIDVEATAEAENLIRGLSIGYFEDIVSER